MFTIERSSAKKAPSSIMGEDMEKGIHCPLCNCHIDGEIWPFPMFEMDKGPSMPSISFKAIVERRFGRKAAKNSPILRKSRRLKNLKARIVKLAKEYDRLTGTRASRPVGVDHCTE